jgi:DNA-binding transcriptional MerR regulator
MSVKGHTVSQVAKLAHVTVRTLHHYDEIGLLVPSQRSAAGYRLYSDEDVARLHQILLFRELGFGLDAIAQVLDEPLAHRRTALKEQRDRLVLQQQRTGAVIRAVDAALEALEGGTPMSTEKMFEGFEEFDHARYEEEARERWGHTEAYQESERRTKSYGKADWARIKDEAQATTLALAALLDRGAAPDSPEAMDAAEQARLHIDRWFYPCSRPMHAALGEMYVTDPRFTATYEKIRPGLAAFVSAAIQANAARG